MKKAFYWIAAWAVVASVAAAALGVSIFGVQEARQSVENANAELSQQVELLTQQVTSLGQMSEDSGATLEQTQEALAVAQTQITAQETQILQYQADIEKYSTDLTGANVRIADLEAQIKNNVARDEKVAALQAELTARDTKIADYEKKDAERVTVIAELQTQIADKDQKLTAADSAYAELMGRLTLAEEDLAGKAALLTETQQQRDAASEQLSELTAERDAANAQVTALTGERDGLSAQVSELTGERDGLSAQVNELTGERGRLSAQIDTLTVERDSANAQVTALTEERNSLSAQVDALTAQIGADKKKVEDAEKALFELYEIQEQLTGLQTVNSELSAQLEQSRELARKHESTAARTAVLEDTVEALNAQLESLNKYVEDLETQLGEYVELPKEVFEGEYVTFTCPDGVTAVQKNKDVYLTHAQSGVQGRIYVWMDESGDAVTPEEMDVRQVLEYVMSTIYGEGERPKTQSIEGMEGYRFSSESAYADGTPCTMEICILRGETVLYYMEMEGSETQKELVGQLTDEVLSTIEIR